MADVPGLPEMAIDLGRHAGVELVDFDRERERERGKDRYR